jgi:hypothetical protein
MQALLGRWAKFAPGKIETRVSHRQGNLGFRAGAWVPSPSYSLSCLQLFYRWWINPLFAHHAGIIGLESINGGTTFDDHSAYAIVLKDAGEVSITPEECLKYRCSVNDKGKFRLTAATPRSREPVRVLRCHNVNSMWGPRAGIRYEGLVSRYFPPFKAMLVDMSIVHRERMVHSPSPERRCCRP